MKMLNLKSKISNVIFGAFVFLLLTGLIFPAKLYAQRATPVPTPTPVTYTISGTVFNDTNGNGIPDAGEGYSGATVQLKITNSRSTTTATSDAAGSYSFTNLSAASYTITLTVPAGYQAKTANPATVTVGPSATVNFGIISTTPTPTTAGAPTPTTAGAPTPTTGPVRFTIAGKVFDDPNRNGVQDSGEQGIGSITVTLVGVARTSTSTPAGAYSFNSLAAGTYTVTITVPRGQNSTTPTSQSITVNATSGDGTANFGLTTLPPPTPTPAPYQLSIQVPAGYNVVGLNGAPYSNNTYTVNIPPASTVNWCISDNFPWFQTTSGDVRIKTLVNNVPVNKNASTDTLNSSVFSSSVGNASFGRGSASNNSPTRWVINDEYSYNNKSAGSLGGTSYSFYKSRAGQTGTTIKSLGCTSPCALSNLDGVYEYNGDLTITSYSHTAGKHVLILVNGNATVQANPLTVPSGAGNLFTLAAKGNINIDASVGGAASSETTNIDGIYSAEGNIVIKGNTSGCPTADLRLNVGGSLIANSVNPYSSAGGGALQNQRSLCSSDARYPSLKVFMRTDFATQLTDFYKVSSQSFTEVAP